jgi:hypothetical protein
LLSGSRLLSDRGLLGGSGLHGLETCQFGSGRGVCFLFLELGDQRITRFARFSERALHRSVFGIEFVFDLALLLALPLKLVLLLSHVVAQTSEPFHRVVVRLVRPVKQCGPSCSIQGAVSREHDVQVRSVALCVSPQRAFPHDDLELVGTLLRSLDDALEPVDLGIEFLEAAQDLVYFAGGRVGVGLRCRQALPSRFKVRRSVGFRGAWKDCG